MASDIPTGFIPMSEISSVNVIVDVEEPEFDQIKEDILTWGRQKGIKVNIFFFDFRKLGNEELLLTSIQTTLLRRELDWIGTPDLTKVTPLIEEKSDLFISLVENGEFPIDFLCKCAKARFKIGRYAYDGNVFDMVISGSPTADLRSDAREIFSKITEFLSKIQ
jgi:hypothetical protein